MEVYMLKKLVKRKQKAFSKASSKLIELQREYQKKTGEYIIGKTSEIASVTDKVDQGRLKNNYIGLNVLDSTKFIYESSSFYNYMQYAFAGKYYDRKIRNIKTLIAILFIIAGVILFFVLGKGILTYILEAILLIVMIVVLVKLKTGESYESFYRRTFLTFLNSTYSDPVFDCNTLQPLLDSDIRQITRRSYDRKKMRGPIGFSGTKCDGVVTDLELIDKTEVRQNGQTREVETIVFDGMVLKINILNPISLLKGNVIRIKADENIFSAIGEDTIRGIYESEKEILFNSEEMNKSFDARISGHNGFNSVDEVLLVAKKILTPSFENHLLYLRKRYNTFSVDISDNYILMSINMRRSLLQKAKHKELFDFKTTYREANEQFRMLRGDLNGIEDFAYYNVFPYMERLYLINYLTYLYLSYTDFDNYYDINNVSINAFEQEMENIYPMSNGEFRKKYTDKIKDIEKNTKKFALNIVKEED